MTTANSGTTSTRDHGVYVAGLGLRQAATVTDLLAAINAACASAGIGVAQLAALATSAEKAPTPAVVAAALQLGVALIAVQRPALDAATGRCLIQSAASLAATGLPSLAEAAALAGAGPRSHLLAPRVAHGAATAAVALSAASTAATLPQSMPGHHTP